MEPATARIVARSHRQAMDWSLVLASQGIETAIEQNEDGTGWGLLVPSAEEQKAQQAIRQYRIENRRWPWRRELFEQGILFDWASLGWVSLVCLLFLVSNGHTGFFATGVMDSALVSHGEWWRLFTAMWLHADAAHLASNATFGLVLLGLAMGRFGTGIGLMAAYLAGFGGNLAVWWLSKPTGPGSLGASGMVMGALGLLAAQSFSLKPHTPHSKRHLVTGIIGGIMLFVLLGLNPETDIRAHFGGFIAGLLIGAVLTQLPNMAARAGVNFFTGLVYAALVIWPWWAGLRPAH